MQLEGNRMTAANSFTMITNNYNVPESDSLGGMEHHHSISIRDHKKKPTTTTTTTSSSSSAYEVVREVARSNAVVVFSMSSCCMCTVVKRLLFGLGVGPTVVELDQLLPLSSTGGAPHEIEDVLFRLQASSSDGGQHNPPVPAVFIGGKFLGGIETLMACHINGSLVPLLKDAGALWL